MFNVLEVYKESKAMLQGHFLLSSGLHSDTYLQSELVMMNPGVAENIIKEFIPKLEGFEFATVVSPAIGGIRFGYELARQTKKRSLFTERVNNEMVFRRGFEIVKGERIIIAEDIVTTGKSVKECAEAIKKLGGEIQAVATMIDRSEVEIDFGVPLISLAKIKVQTWSKDKCPHCLKGDKAIKPGSRK